MPPSRRFSVPALTARERIRTDGDAGAHQTPGREPYCLALAGIAADGGSRRVCTFEIAEISVEVRASSDSLWAFARREGKGGLAIRAAFLAGPFECKLEQAGPGEARRLRLRSALDEHLVVFRSGAGTLEFLRVTVELTPRLPMVMPSAPRDLYPIDSCDDPLGAQGCVEAVQRRLNTGLVYFKLEEPAFGNVLYVQN